MKKPSILALVEKIGWNLEETTTADFLKHNYLTYPPFNGIIHVKVQHPNDENLGLNTISSHGTMLDFFNNQQSNCESWK